jgi:hypothetical protein
MNSYRHFFEFGVKLLVPCGISLIAAGLLFYKTHLGSLLFICGLVMLALSLTYDLFHRRDRLARYLERQQRYLAEATAETSIPSMVKRLLRCRIMLLAGINIAVLVMAVTQNQPLVIVIPSFLISLGALLVLSKAATDRIIVTNRRAYSATTEPLSYRLNVIGVAIVYFVASCAPLIHWLLRDHR